MEIYTQDEKVDMLLIYGECKRNAIQAEIMYRDRYPGRHHPTRHYFKQVEKKFRENPNENEQEKFIIDENTEIDTLAWVNLHPTASTREIAEEVDISHQSVWKILKKYKYRSFKFQLHQHLYENDNNRRLEYCNQYLGKLADDWEFPYKILYSDESRFTNNGMFNKNNTRYWAKENPRLLRQGHFQERFGFNVWMGIIGTRLVGPIIFDGQLNGERYLSFLRNEIENFVDDLPL